MFPASAALIQDAIGAGNAAAFDVNAACNGFMVALATASQFVNSGAYHRVLVIGSECMSRIVNWGDRSTCVLFGDGAGAIILEHGESGGIGPVILKNDGSKADRLYAPGPGAAPRSLTEAEGFCIVMDGREVFKVAVRAMEDVSLQALRAAGLTVDDVTYMVPHQANLRIMSAVAKSMGIGPERLISNVEKYGNTSSASIPLALCEAWQEGKLTPGDKLVFVAIGGGLSWGASVVEWTGVGSKAARRSRNGARRGLALARRSHFQTSVAVDGLAASLAKKLFATKPAELASRLALHVGQSATTMRCKQPQSSVASQHGQSMGSSSLRQVSR